MTDRDLKRLSRTDLLEMMIALTKENEQLRQKLEETERKLGDKMIAIEKCGSIAEAALALNGVFEAAEKACAQYVANLQARAEAQSGEPSAPDDAETPADPESEAQN